MGSVGLKGGLKAGQHCALHEEFAGTSLAHKVTNRGRHVWQVRRNKVGLLYIAISVLSTERGWVYVKSMDEGVHPYYYDCPLEFLQMVHDTANMAWRAEVYAHHARCNAVHEISDPVVVHGKPYRVVGGPKPSRTHVYIVCSTSGKIYRAKRCGVYTPDEWAAQEVRESAWETRSWV